MSILRGTRSIRMSHMSPRIARVVSSTSSAKKKVQIGSANCQLRLSCSHWRCLSHDRGTQLLLCLGVLYHMLCCGNLCAALFVNALQQHDRQDSRTAGKRLSYLWESAALCTVQKDEKHSRIPGQQDSMLSDACGLLYNMNLNLFNHSNDDELCYRTCIATHATQQQARSCVDCSTLTCFHQISAPATATPMDCTKSPST